MEEEQRKKEELKRQEEDWQKAEEARIRRDKRERVIDELIRTERDYLHGLHLCIETFISPTRKKNARVDIKAVFDNIGDVADVSQRLLTLLEKAVIGQDFEKQLLGPCFIQLCDDMKNVYATYCRNHDEVIAVLEKYKEDQSIKQYFDDMLKKLREKIVVSDLEALLIKPVQRILNYPLLLNELINSTEDSHKDKVEILKGINAMTDVATAINEYKCRKDLGMCINKLPHEVLTEIFSYLPQLDLLKTINIVCNYWNKVAFSSPLWKTVNITHDDVDIYLQNIAHYEYFVQNLVIPSTHFTKFLDTSKCLNLPNLVNLRMICYNYPCKYTVNFNPKVVSILLRTFKSDDICGYLSVLSDLQLRDFDILTMGAGDTMALNKKICEFISKQSSLPSWSIHFPGLQSETIITLFRNVKDLTCLDLSNSTGVDGCGFTDLPELSKLTTLNLSYTSVDDEGLKNFAKKASHLKKLTLVCCEKLSDIGIEYIADGFHCLEHLVIFNLEGDTRGVRLFPSTLETLGKGCQKLKYFEVGFCTGLDDSGVIALVQNCHDLEYLELESENISAQSLNAISHSCSNLFHLKIHGSNFNAASVQSLLTEHIFIKYVSIGSCSNINAINLCKSTETESGILKTHSHVNTLSIDGQTDIGCSAIEQIVTFCPDLRQLTLSPINTAVIDDVTEIAFHKCPFLEMLEVDWKTIYRSDFKTNLK